MNVSRIGRAWPTVLAAATLGALLSSVARAESPMAAPSLSDAVPTDAVPTDAVPTEAGATATGPVGAWGVPAGFVIPEAPVLAPAEEPEAVWTTVDFSLAQKLKAARDAERVGSTEEKIERWTAVIQHLFVGGENPYRAFAERRIEVLRTHEKALAARADALAILRAKFRSDYLALVADSKGADGARASLAEDEFQAAYRPFEGILGTLDLTDLPPITAREAPKTAPPETPRAPLADPLGRPFLVAQRVIVKAQFGAQAQAFHADTADETLSAVEPTSYDVSGFWAGGRVIVNVAEESGFAVGLSVGGRYYVTASLPDTIFESGDGSASFADTPSPGALFVHGGVRLGGNLIDRIGLSAELDLGYLQFLAPPVVFGCGADELAWDPAQRGFQGELGVGAEFYPLSMLSLGLGGRIGVGHVEGEFCVPSRLATSNDAVISDVSATAFSAGAVGDVGVHF